MRELARAIPGVEVDAAGRLVADPETGRTGHPQVFAGGDAVSGGDLVVTVAQAGKRAARAICARCGVTPAPDSPVMAGRL
jgi:glutamate synthase (NADPH/NADH) small chain